MKTTTTHSELAARLLEVWEKCPELRFGQMIATVSELARDNTGQGIWDVEDPDFLAALQKFAGDLDRRNSNS